MHDVLIEYLNCLTQNNSEVPLSVRNEFKEFYEEDYRNGGSYWVRDRSPELIAETSKKPYKSMTVEDVLICLTTIVARNRIYGSISGAERHGSTLALLGRLKELSSNNYSRHLISKEQIRQAMYGLAIADAVGVPAEFTSRETLKQTPFTDMTGYGTHNQPKGTWSDDTSMALCLAYSLGEKKTFVAEDVMNRFISWYTEGSYSPFGECFDCGIAVSKALRKYQQGFPALECGGKDKYDNGNGSMMRILPLLFHLVAKYGMDVWYLTEASEEIIQCSAITHAHPISCLACNVYLHIAEHLLRKQDILFAVSSGTRQSLRSYRNKVPKKIAETVERFQKFEDPYAFKDTPEDEIKSSGFVVDTLEAAIWCLLNTDNYKDCVLKAVNLGDDTDTVAAVAGGLAGIAYGFDCERGIPKEWYDALQAKDMIEKACDALETAIS